MAKNKIKDITNMQDEEIQTQIGENENRLKKMKFSHSITPVENPMAIRDIRKNIARLKTEQRRRLLNN